ncbi:mRNA export factor mex67 [Coccidioides immitis RS]|uniref:mRNA export factor MEX67 n=3 Tax=Coccidioides immitis TaxID=5501 RepID=A0A0E1S3J9_COCIM|nr:mRNA export factor mex67 [Coccidioides immitis RS]EAS33858.2 mRNA export factor mex67 [Coccidioides immitis RS]KMP05051.1 mRNA export factor mex67 [Coccidioides immitis RMSCC 2394]KMU90981.1 mRNA export factor mex67 [Coccidioides immitis H538.4]
MLQIPSARMNSSRPSRGSRSRTGTPDRGGIRKRGAAQRVDRDGDLDMGVGGAGRGRGIGRAHTRGDLSRRATPASRHGGDKEKTLDALQKAIFGASSQANIRRGRTSGMEVDRGLSQLKVRGWKASRAASNPDGGVESLIAFLEKKATPPDPNSGVRLKIIKSRVEGDALVVSVRPEQVDWVLRISGFSFAGAPLTVERHDKSGFGGPVGGPSPGAADTKAKMTAFLAKRYFEPKKLLDLSKLGTDPDLIEMGMFNTTSTESKFFPALMKICELTFDSSEKRRTAVESVSLAENQLSNVAPVTSLAQTFPDLKNLDLSNNRLRSTENMSSWRWKFRKLEFLDLTGNEATAQPGFKETMLKWYPKLQTLNNTPVRTPEEIAAQKKTPIPVKGPVFHDESSIAENFLKAFFFNFDNNKDEVLNGMYDERSIFSLNVNVLAPRALQNETPAGWDGYIKKSRNLQRINHLSARMSRAYVGVENIRNAWNSLPRTNHPGILTNPKDWLIECNPIPGLLDITGQSKTGVGGLLITVHGKFDELDMKTGSKIQTRSFDRTFVLGPGRGPGGVRVSNDMLCLRAFGDCQAWIPEDQHNIPATVRAQTMVQPAAQPLPAVQPIPAVQPVPSAQGAHPQAKPGYGVPAPGKTDEQVKKEQLVLEISFKTRMTLEFSEMALSGNNWNMEAALKNFEELKAQGKLPANAFLPGV